VNKRGDWGRPLVLSLARRHCGMKLRELGERMGGMDYAAVSIMLKRWNQRVQNDRCLQRLSDRTTAMLNLKSA